MNPRGILLYLLIFLSFGFSHADSDIAVVLIDMQSGFLDETDQQIRHDLIAKQMQLLKWAQENNHAILVFESVGYGPTELELQKEIAKFGRRQTFLKAADPGFNTGALEKDRMGTRRHTYRNFEILRKELDASPHSIKTDRPSNQLRSWKIKKLIVAGVNGSACVTCSVREALENNFAIYTAADTVADLGNWIEYPSYFWWHRHQEVFKAGKRIFPNFFPFDRLQQLTSDLSLAQIEFPLACQDLFP